MSGLNVLSNKKIPCVKQPIEKPLREIGESKKGLSNIPVLGIVRLKSGMPRFSVIFIPLSMKEGQR